ncbi:uncharacterized protein NECHADRAFT_35919 [Fusarium vanettenii 77-13-4]|uniref:Uncharacterized protein n=1 Tax=Fusarium vanettenii (strain ATCC MYA-4622 / CBS 123669 / FGSC 9596 / NRRL 45880 / 77-13-4) TaxID=660122 RepID=C7YLF6_FUSV7|nr:uncharacterized protein NECHADRAFT_35919 [Fusarium vanettenii 77-13-4]EEU46778.1 hypothetical protein NECHADRAFT_35919 [Fusarium vanettenii 77-13-4]
MVAVDSRQPDLCVGIDFGTTYTGVSWITPKEQRNQTNIITRWPGEVANEDKVPTILAKDASGGETRWGFLCKELAEDKKWRFFKLLLDPDMHNQLLTKNEHELWVPGSIGQLQEIVTLYLRQIYTYLSNEIPKLVKADLTFSRQLRLKTWDSLTIDFIFSTPTTWQAPVSQCFKSIVSKAGFGENKLHKVALGLTEPEAAAVFTYQAERVGKVYKGEVVLSIDAGGGTTDLAFVEATADTADSLTLNEVHPINGVGVGSTGIDREFAKLIEDRIKAHPNALSKLPTGFPLRASQSDDFQTWKHRLGSKDWDQSKSDFLIEVAGLEKSYSNEDLGIRRGRLSFTRQQLESCFDTILKQIKSLIKEALHNFEGGNARMVVVEGLLYDRRTEVHALRNHIARANYGIVIEESRSGGPARFPGGPTIHWLVKLGDTIQLGKPVTIDVTKRLEKSDPRRWTEKIVWLRGAGKFLPETVKDEVGMEELRSVDIEVRPGAKLSAGGRTWMRTSTYDKFKFELMLVVGPSGDCDVEVSENVIKRSE